MNGELVKAIQEILEKCIEKHDGKASKVARAIGTSEANISRWRKGVSPNIKEVEPLMDLMGLSLSKDMMEFAYIPKKAAKAGAGSSLVIDGKTTGYYAFRRQFLQRMGISENKAVLFDVLGSSMQPILQNGDTILVDESKTDPQDGQIFLVGVDEELLVKRIFKTQGGWILKSANPDYPDMVFMGQEVNNLRIFGKVMWFGRVL